MTKLQGSEITIIIDNIVKHGLVRVLWDFWQVQPDVIALAYELLELGAVVQLQVGADAPHEREDVQVLIVRPGQLTLLLLGRDQAL